MYKSLKILKLPSEKALPLEEKTYLVEIREVETYSSCQEMILLTHFMG